MFLKNISKLKSSHLLIWMNVLFKKIKSLTILCRFSTQYGPVPLRTLINLQRHTFLLDLLNDNLCWTMKWLVSSISLPKSVQYCINKCNNCDLNQGQAPIISPHLSQQRVLHVDDWPIHSIFKKCHFANYCQPVHKHRVVANGRVSASF